VGRPKKRVKITNVKNCSMIEKGHDRLHDRVSDRGVTVADLRFRTCGLVHIIFTLKIEGPITDRG
jgi:hypothetical protein